jgi:hypothetical protein
MAASSAKCPASERRGSRPVKGEMKVIADAGRAAHFAVFVVTRVERKQSEFAVEVLFNHHTISSIKLGGDRTDGGTPCAALDPEIAAKSPARNLRSFCSPSAQLDRVEQGWAWRAGACRFNASPLEAGKREGPGHRFSVSRRDLSVSALRHSRQAQPPIEMLALR